MCPNGHCTTNSLESNPAHSSRFCTACGEATFSTCPHCTAPIRGYYYVVGFVSVRPWSPPSYCHECGHAYPWTERRIESAIALADEFEELSQEEKDVLKQAIPALGTDTPQTELAATRYSKLRDRLGTTASSTLDKVVGALATEAVKAFLGM